MGGWLDRVLNGVMAQLGMCFKVRIFDAEVTFRTWRPLARCSGFKGASISSRFINLCNVAAVSYSTSVISAKGSLSVIPSGSRGCVSVGPEASH